MTQKIPPHGEHEQWTQAELNALHKMVRDYMFTEQLRVWIVPWAKWGVGLPATVLIFWEPLARLWKLLKGG